MWNVIIKLCSVYDKLHSSTEGKIREEMVEFQVSEGSTIYDLKQRLACHARRPAEQLTLVFGVPQLENRLVVGCYAQAGNGSDNDIPWFRGTSGRKVVNLVGVKGSSWNIGLVVAMATQERLGLRLAERSCLGVLTRRRDMMKLICIKFNELCSDMVPRRPPAGAGELSLSKHCSELTKLSDRLDPRVALVARRSDLFGRLDDASQWASDDQHRNGTSPSKEDCQYLFSFSTALPKNNKKRLSWT